MAVTPGSNGVRHAAPDVYVKLRGLTPTGVGRLRWWARLGREVRSHAAAPARGTTTLRRVVSLARRGFYPSAPALFRLDQHRLSDYVSDRWRAQTWKLNWPAAGLLDDKLAFYFMCKQLAVPTPEVTGVVIRGSAYPLHGTRTAAGTQWLRRRLDEVGAVVLRPTRGGGGKDLFVVRREGDAYHVNGETAEWAAVEALMARLADHVASDFVEQADYAQEVFAETTNTLRVLTMHPGDGPPFVAAAAHRFGTPASAPVDSWSRGGISAGIDTETGTLGRGTARPTPTVPARWLDRHPTSGVRFDGIVIPGWREIRESLVDAASRMPFLPYVGWDLIVTADGFSVIEGNKFPELGVLQVHAPLLRDPRVRDFYRSRGFS